MTVLPKGVSRYWPVKLTKAPPLAQGQDKWVLDNLYLPGAVLSHAAVDPLDNRIDLVFTTTRPVSTEELDLALAQALKRRSDVARPPVGSAAGAEYNSRIIRKAERSPIGRFFTQPARYVLGPR